MEKRTKVLLFSGMTLLSLSLTAWALCPPGRVPANPAPVAPSTSDKADLFRVLDTFFLDEEQEEEILLEKGRSYWFAANGCPKMGKIQITLVDAKGEVLKQEKAFAPSFCFTASESGKYRAKVKAASLSGNSRSGTIEASLSESGCSASSF